MAAGATRRQLSYRVCIPTASTGGRRRHGKLEGLISPHRGLDFGGMCGDLAEIGLLPLEPGWTLSEPGRDADRG